MLDFGVFNCFRVFGGNTQSRQYQTTEIDLGKLVEFPKYVDRIDDQLTATRCTPYDIDIIVKCRWEHMLFGMLT